MISGLRKERLRVAFVHPSLGIGGAERLIVDAAVGLQKMGHTVDIYTLQHDHSHSFKETNDGTLHLHIYGSFLPVYLLGAKVLFYCHFPDKQCDPRGTLHSIYRAPFDKLEEYCISRADFVAVNSEFTKRVFHQAFPSFKSTKVMTIYPAINTESYGKAPHLPRKTEMTSFMSVLKSEKKRLLSINRFSSKKNLNLAVDALRKLKTICTKAEFDNVQLVLAGAFMIESPDENACYRELCKIAEQNGFTHETLWPAQELSPEESARYREANILFVVSFNEDQRSVLLSPKVTSCLLYTPTNEHFGIVPIEAMYCQLPVIAVNNGGPTESVVNGKTGFLCNANAKEFAEKIREVCFRMSDEQRLQMGNAGRFHVEKNFTSETFIEQFDSLLSKITKK